LSQQLAHELESRNALDAYVSTQRIKGYLDSPEKRFMSTPSKRIAINNATISWPADTEDKKDRFCLQDVNLDFPIGELRRVFNFLHVPISMLWGLTSLKHHIWEDRFREKSASCSPFR
jgi:hypothetical protein